VERGECVELSVRKGESRNGGYERKGFRELLQDKEGDFVLVQRVGGEDEDL
jgi:hypothetical protein